MRSRFVPAIALIAAAALQALPAAAQMRVGGGVEVLGPNNSAAVAQADVRDLRRPGGQTRRCWQNGRLLYEGSGFRGAGLERRRRISSRRRGKRAA